MFRKLPLFSVIASALLVTAVRAEKPQMSPEELRETATDVVTGKVMAIYARAETSGDWKYTKYVAEIRVDGCEKGDGARQGNLVYARYWTRGWIGKGEVPPSTAGHRDLPRDGEVLRVYMARNAYDGFGSDNKDGGFNVIGANGFEKLKATPQK